MEGTAAEFPNAAFEEHTKKLEEHE